MSHPRPTTTSSWADASVTTAGALTYVLTAPGQTATVSVLIDPLVADLGVMEEAALPRYFGTGSIGEIRGIVHTVRRLCLRTLTVSRPEPDVTAHPGGRRPAARRAVPYSSMVATLPSCCSTATPCCRVASRPGRANGPAPRVRRLGDLASDC